MAIAKCAVIGAGVMGGGIAAQIANAGVPVMLLDIVPPNANNRNVIAETAIEKMLKTEPAPFMSPRAARLVTPGNIEDDLPKLADCDWIVEAVLEKIEIKHATYEKLAKVRKAGSIVSSNTSTIPLKDLTAGLPDAFTKDFLITHFFNPPRYMRLLEIVTGPKTEAAAVAAIDEFCDVKLGKHVIHAKDTPGFIANRIGGMWIQAAIQAAFDLGLSVEEADAIMGRPFGMPRTGVFGLLDLVGLDLMPQVAASMQRTLPKDDLYLATMKDRPLLAKMIADGYTGRKGKGGFYRLQRGADGSRVKEGIDLATGQYRKSEDPSLASAIQRDPAKILSAQDRGGQYARRVLAYTLQYAASLVPEIADSVNDVDQAMKLGYNWSAGPFELIDKIGAANVAGLIQAEKLPVPPLLAKPLPFYRVNGGFIRQRNQAGEWVKIARRPGVLLLGDVKRATQPVAKNGSASLWDIGDGVLCVEFHSRMNSLDGDSLGMIKTAMETIKKSAGKYVALVIHNEAEHFSAGANVGLALFAANIALWPFIEEGEASGQKILKEMKYAPFPTVSAPSGMALGGGCEILLHSSAVQAHARVLYRPGRGRRRAGAGLGRLRRDDDPRLHQQARAARTDRAARADFRDDRIGQSVEVGGGSARPYVPAPDRRHHHEPRPAARRRQGARAVARQELRAAEAGHAAPARPDRRRGHRPVARRSAQAGQGQRPRSRRRRQARGGAVRRRHRRDRGNRRGPVAGAGAQGVPGADPHRQDAGADRTHAGNRPPAAELK